MPEPRVPAGAAGESEPILRVFFDVSYTRTQGGAVGITRTVRSLLAQLRHGAAPAVECVPVAFHTRGFRVVSDALMQGPSAAQDNANGSLAARFLRRLTNSRLRRRMTAAFPVVVLRPAFAAFNWITFDALTRHAAPAQFARGDVLLLCDASWNYDVWAGVRAAQRAGAKAVVMLHDLIPLRHPEFGMPLLTATFRTWVAEMVRAADAIVCNSASTMHDLQAYAREQGWALPPVGHIRLGSDLSVATGPAPTRPALVRMTDGAATCFAAVGTIERRKNYQLLLAAFEQSWAQGHEMRLVLIGRASTECAAFVRALVAHPEQGKRLLTLFDGTDAEVAHAYANARALIFPSLAEGFGLPLVEARTRGALVIASDIPVFRELADDGVLIFERDSVAQLRDRIFEVAAADPRRLPPAMASFTWSDSACQLMAVVRPLLRGAAA